MAPSARVLVGSVGICAIFWLAMGLIIASITSVKTLTYGLKVDGYTLKIHTEKVYEPGRYFLGYKKHFLSFPSTRQILIFSDKLRMEKDLMDGANFQEDTIFSPTIYARSKEGLSVALDVVVYFKLGVNHAEISLGEQLARIYADFGDNWKDIVQRMVTFEMRNIAGEYSIFQYFEKRRQLSDDFEAALRESLKEFFFDLKTVSIINLKIPTGLEEAIMGTEIVKQQVLTLNYTLQAKRIESKTRELEAEQDKLMFINTAETDGKVYLLMKQGLANATQSVYEIQQDAFGGVKTNLGFSSTDGAQKLLTWYWIYIQRFHNVSANTFATDIPVTIQSLT